MLYICPTNQIIKVMSKQARTHKLDVDFNLILDRDAESAQTTYDTLLFCQEHDIVFEVNEWDGPGGGNNWLTFYGTEASLKALCDEYLEEEYYEFIEQA